MISGPIFFNASVVKMRLFYVKLVLTIWLFHGMVQGGRVEVSVRGNGYVWSSNTTWLYSEDNLLSLVRISRMKRTIPADASLRVYFLARSSQEANIELRIKSKSLYAIFEVSLWKTGNVNTQLKSQTVRCFYCQNVNTLDLGHFEMKEAGYHFFKITVPNSNLLKLYQEIVSIVFERPDILYIEANRGKSDGSTLLKVPSLHFTYAVPEDSQITSIYTEMLVPKGYDRPGAFYMATGFDGGYFGIQVNSQQEKRILFSVWSNFPTDEPEKIPLEYKVSLVNKGRDVIINDFGNEGAGAQSFLQYPWKTHSWFKFLLTANAKDESTIYTAYFQAPEFNGFRLIASWLKPKSGGQLLRDPNSFVEHFHYEQLGFLKFKCVVKGLWYKIGDGQWEPAMEGVVTTTASESEHQRHDIDVMYNGGVLEMTSGGFENFYNVSLLKNILKNQIKGPSPVVTFEPPL